MHATLLRQLRRALKATTPAEADHLLHDLFSLAESGNLSAQQSQALSGLRDVLTQVDESYRQFDRAQDLRLRSLTISSAELMDANRRLREEAAQQKSLVESMRTTANHLLMAADREPISAGETSVQRVAQRMEQLIAESEAARLRLAESESRFRGLTSLSSDWYWEQDAQQRFTQMSQGITAVTGRSAETFIGLTSEEAFGSDPAQAGWNTQQELLRRMRDGEPFRDFEGCFTPKGHDPVYVSLSGEPFTAGDGKFGGYRGVARNITAQKRAENRLQVALYLTDTLIESMPMPLTIKDRDHRFVRINSAYEREFEVSRDDALGRTAPEVLNDPARGGHDIEEALLRNPGAHSFTRQLHTPDGEKYFVLTKATVLDDSGSVTGFITTHANVTSLKLAEQRLEDQLQFTNVILETSPEPMMVKNGAREITYVNSAYEKLFEVDRKDILTRKMRLHTADTINDIERIELELLQQPGTRQFEYVLPATSGRAVYCIITKSTFRDRTGGIGGIVTTYTDITNLKTAERAGAEQLRLTTTFLDASPTPTVVKDRNLVLTRCNSAYEKMFGVRRDDILNQPMTAHRTQFAEEVLAIERRLLAQPGTHRIERRIKIPGKSDMHCVIDKSTYFNGVGEVEGIITTFTDINELKQTEESLREAKLVAEQAMRARSQFLANMSHEIRTPMNGVLGMADVLAGTPLTAEQCEYLDNIRNSGESLLKIVNDILDFSKIEAGKVELEQVGFDLRSRITSIMQLFSASAREKQLKLDSTFADDLPQRVRGDPVRISQILSNLIANAIKFTEVGFVRLDVSVHVRAGEDLMLRFDVRDTGIGISADAVERIFDPFSQEDASTTRRFGGTGLGLTISRQLVGLMGGELSVVSTQGKGSVFSFTAKLRDGGMMPEKMPVATRESSAAIPVHLPHRWRCDVISLRWRYCWRRTTPSIRLLSAPFSGSWDVVSLW